MGVQYSITYFPFVLGRIFLWVLRNLWHKILEADVVDILDDRLLHTDPLQLKKKKRGRIHHSFCIGVTFYSF